MSHRICGIWYVSIVLLCVFALYAISYADVTPVADRTAQVRDKIVAVVPDVDSAVDVTAEHLSTIRSLNLRLLKITTLASGDFSGLTGLTSLNLYGNQLSSLPAGIFEGLTSLTSLRLGRNTVDPLPLTVSLEKVAEGEFKAVVPAGATFDIVLPITVTNGSITGGATELTISQGDTESSLFVVTRTPGTTDEVTVDIGTLPSLPRNHYGYTFTKSGTLPLTVIAGINTDPVVKVPDVQEVVTVETPNTAPTFADGTSTTRSVAENVPAGTNIGAPITATDAEDDTLTWTLGGVDADSFEINSTTGQLKTKAPLDYETKRVYSVTLTVADEALSDTITVIISVIDVSDTVFAAGVFPVVDRTPQVRDTILEAIPTVHNATQVTATHLASITALNLRNKGISALKTGDFSGLAALTDLNLYGNQLSSLPVGTFDGLGALTTLRLSGNVVDPLPLIVSLQQVRDNVYRAIIPTGAPFPIRLPITVTDGSVSGGITSVVIPQGSRHSAAFTVVGTSAKVSIGMLPRLPRNHFGYVLAQSTVSSRTEQVITAIAAAIGVSDSRSVTEIDLATITGLDLSGTSLTTLKTGDFADMVSLTTLNLSNNALTNLPAGIFDDAPSLRSITLANNRILSLPDGVFTRLSSLSTVDLSGNGITSLSGDTFSGLSALTTLNLSNNKLSTLSSGIFDGLTSLNQLSLSGNTVDPLQIGVSLQKVGTNQFKAVAPTGAPFNIVLPLEQIYGTVRGGVKTIQIPKGSVESRPLTMVRIPNTIASVTVDIVNVPHLPSNHNGYVLVKSMSQRLVVLPKLNAAPEFTEGTSTIRSVLENTAAGTNIGTPVSATDANEDTLTYQLSGTDAAAFAIDTASGQLQTSALLDYETESSYTVTLTVSDGKLTDTITVTINVTDVVEITVIEENEPEDSAQQETTTNTPPVFTDGTSATRSVAENTVSGVDIGAAVSATDADNDALTYMLGGTDANAFSINSTNGQLRTSAALDYENKNSYSITVSVSDGNGGINSITVTINVTDVVEITVIEEDEPEDSAQQETTTNTPPVFTDGTSTTRSIAENTGSGVDIGSAVSATDADSGDTLTYTLGGTDVNAFSINSTNGQLRTSAALDYENKNSYSVTVSVSDGNGGTDSITVTINVTDVVEITVIEEDEPEDSAQQETTTNTPPVFTDGTSTTRSVAENTGSGVNIGTAVSATDADSGDTLTYTLGGTDENAFSINSTNGQLRTSAALDYENKNSYSVTVSVSDGNGGTDSITVTINVTDVNENRAPVFTEGDSTTRSVAENTGSGVNIGSAVSATDADNDTLTYTLGGTDAASFSIDSTSGQLQTKASLDYESKASYSVIVSVSDGNSGSDSTDVTISVTDVDENSAPVTVGTISTDTLTVEKPSVQIDVSGNFSDPDDDTLTYTASSDDTSVATASVSGFSVTITSAGTGSATITVTASDGQLTATQTIAVSADVDKPDVSFSLDLEELRYSNVLHYTTNGPFKLTITFSEPVSGFEVSDLDVDDEYTYSDFKAVDAKTIDGTSFADTYTVQIIPDPNEISERISVYIEPGVATDAAGNPNTGALSPKIEVEKFRPRVEISVPAADVTTTTFTIEITFDGGRSSFKRPLGFEQSDLSLTNNTAGATITSWTDNKVGAFQVEITVTQSGSVTFGVAENVATDLAKNGNTAAVKKTVTITLPGSDPPEKPEVDTTPPSISFSLDLEELRYSNALHYTTNGPFTLTITFSEPVSGFEVSDLEVDDEYTYSDFKAIDAKTIDGTSFATTYTVQINPVPNEISERISVYIEAGVATDDAGNLNTAALSPKIEVEKFRPRVEISVPDADVTTTTFTIEITFDGGRSSFKRPLGFEQSDLSLTNNTAGATITSWTDNKVGAFQVEITVTQSGSVTFGVAENVATDLAKNGNTAAVKKTVTITLPGSDPPEKPEVDTTPPSISFSLDLEELRYSNALHYTTNGPFTLTITFSEPVSGFEVSDLEVDDEYTYSDFKAVDAKTIEGTSFATTYTVQIIPDPNEIWERISLYIEAGVATDDAGNPNTGALSPKIEVEKFRPRVEISVPDADVTTTTFTIEITFDGGRSSFKRPLGFEQSDLSLTNNTAGATITSWTDNKVGAFQVEITVTQSGQVTFGVAENVATDLAKNGNTAAVKKTVTITLSNNQGEAPIAKWKIDKTQLFSNYPNPFNPETWIPYQLAKPSEVTITIFDVRGRVVRTLILDNQPAGLYRSRSKAAHWDGKNTFGEKVAGGMYFYMLTAGEFSATRKMLILK